MRMVKSVHRHQNNPTNVTSSTQYKHSSSLPRRVWWPSLYDEVKDTFSRSPSLLVDHRRCLRIGEHFNISSKANRHPEQTVVTTHCFTLSAIQFGVINEIWKMFGKIYFGIGVIFWKMIEYQSLVAIHQSQMSRRGQGTILLLDRRWWISFGGSMIDSD